MKYWEIIADLAAWPDSERELLIKSGEPDLVHCRRAALASKEGFSLRELLRREAESGVYRTPIAANILCDELIGSVTGRTRSGATEQSEIRHLDSSYALSRPILPKIT
jgi:hypothetical protein